MLFLYRLKNTEDRDACAYIDEIPSTFDCEHYFSGVRIQGACYCGGEFASYEDIETILTKREYKNKRNQVLFTEKELDVLKFKLKSNLEDFTLIEKRKSQANTK